MRTIEQATAFKRDYKREAKGQHRASLAGDLKAVLLALATDVPLAPKRRDHDLTGNWSGYRECHIKPDLLLIYRNTDGGICDWRGLVLTANYSANTGRS